MNNNLNFLEKFTVEQFNQTQGTSFIACRRNEATGKLFFTYGNRSGAISSSGIPEKPVISLVHPEKSTMPTADERQHIGCSIMDADGHRHPDPKAGGYFYLLHQEGEGGATLVKILQ